MTPDLLEQLNAALGDCYRIVRELGGGGMSRVFLADDLALERAVVIKVLHPELAAGVNAERFKREVFLSARLQHPHIVPVLTAGDVEGLPYYVMPFVKGETLRTRIEAGPVPFHEISGILGDVAKALGYAHSENVVHRDIKPENILLSGGAATVADFGIAKALSSARREVDSGLTSVGTSLGTPAYMAPEQVAGDPNTDHRADIYSLGCVAYELVTGKSPFAGKSPQQMLAAQVIEQPVPVETLRAGVPKPLALAVMRSLDKEPSRRPQNAAELIALLETHDALPTAATAGRMMRLPLIAATVTIALIAIAVPLYKTIKAPPTVTGDLNLAVAPFEVLDPQLALWKEGIVDVLARNLDGAGPIKSMSPGVTIKAWGGRAERTEAVAFGKKIGAQLVIYGQLQSAGPGMVSAKLWIVDSELDPAPVEIEVRDSVSRMDRITDSLSFRSLAAIGRIRTIGAARLASLGSSSLPAIRAFLQGAQHFRRTQWDSAAIALTEATRIDTTFGIAYAMLGQSYGWITEGGTDRQWKAYESAGNQIRPGLSPHDSLTLVAAQHYAIARRPGPNRVQQMREALAASAAVVERYPDDATALYQYADMRFHFDRELPEREALAGFDRAIRADSAFAPAYIHAIELAYRSGPELGRQYADAYLAHPQSAEQRTALLLAKQMAEGKLRGADVQKVFDTLSLKTGRDAHTFLRRLPDSAEVALQFMRAAARRVPNKTGTEINSTLVSLLGYRGHVSEAFRAAIDNASYTAAEIVVLGLVPADSGAKLIGPWISRRDDASFYSLPVLGVARDTAQLNKLSTGALALARTDTSYTRKNALMYFSQAAHAYSVLATGDSTAATPLFDALSDTTFTYSIDQFIRARLVARKDPRRALTLLERMVPSVDIMYPAQQLERGRIAERLGDRERAVDAFAFVTEAWRNTDSPQLREAVKEATLALKRLDSDGKLRASLNR